MREKRNNKVESIDYFLLDVENNLEEEIEKDFMDFYVDGDTLIKTEVPSNLNKEVRKSIRLIKRDKKKRVRDQILDILIVIIFLLPIIGVINPDIFIKIPKAHLVFENINEGLQKDRIMSLLGFSKKTEVIEGEASSSKETVFVEEADVKTPTNNLEAIKLIHSLANTLIHAEYKWECSEVTPNTIDKALEGVEFIEDDYDRMHLRNSITKWSKGNFSNGVEVHNYVWEMLDGSVGKAYTLDDKVIESIKEKYFNN